MTRGLNRGRLCPPNRLSAPARLGKLLRKLQSHAMEVCMALLQATSALRAGMLLTKEQMAALRAAAYPLSTPKRAPNPSIIVTPQKRSRSG